MYLFYDQNINNYYKKILEIVFNFLLLITIYYYMKLFIYCLMNSTIQT